MFEYLADPAGLIVATGVILIAGNGITEVIKGASPVKLNDTVLKIIPLVLCILFAVAGDVSLFEKAKVNELVFYIGAILVGIIASLGANKSHDLLDILATLRKTFKK